MTKARKRIGIVGAGPAGARAAELLCEAGADVVLLDPKVPWEKPCGGGLTPPVFREFPELEELKADARPIHRVRLELGPDRGFVVPLDSPIWMVSRTDLARWQLQRALERGARHLASKVRSIHRGRIEWQLDTDAGALAVDLLVGADGAASLVRRSASPKLNIELAPTRVAYPLGPGPSPDTAVVRLYSTVSGYLWDFPRADHRSVGIGVPNRTWQKSRLDGEIDSHRHSSEECDCPDFERGGAVIGTAQLGHGDYSGVGGPDFALLGDAAGFADPLTGEGIRNSLLSAGLLADAWTRDRWSDYPELARDRFESEFRKARMVRRILLETEWGASIVAKAAKSNLWYPALVAALNALNEHDARLTVLGRRWAASVRRVRRAPDTAGRDERKPVPCPISGADDTLRAHECETEPVCESTESREEPLVAVS